MKIKEVLKHYFSEPSIWLYIIIASILGWYTFQQGYIQQYWYLFIILIIVAPFYEWVAHKYLLHDLIGNIFSIEKQDGVKIGDKIFVDVLDKQQEVEIMSITDDKMEVGYGKAKNSKFYRDFMDRLHIGHHENPNDIKLIFAPYYVALLLFLKFFLLVLLLTFNIGMALTFTFATVLYYLHYEWMHLAHHIPGYEHLFPWSKNLKKAHLFHHYRNENYWWGITNIAGDMILGTYPNYKDVKLSKTVMNINHKPKKKKTKI